MDKMMDMGRKEEVSSPVGSKKDARVSYPGFSLRGDKILKEIKDMKIGEMCECKILVKKVSDSIDTYSNNQQRVEVEIHKLGAIGGSYKDDKLAKKLSNLKKGD